MLGPKSLWAQRSMGLKVLRPKDPWSQIERGKSPKILPSSPPRNTSFFGDFPPKIPELQIVPLPRPIPMGIFGDFPPKTPDHMVVPVPTPSPRGFLGIFPQKLLTIWLSPSPSPQGFSGIPRKSPKNHKHYSSQSLLTSTVQYQSYGERADLLSKVLKFSQALRTLNKLPST